MNAAIVDAFGTPPRYGTFADPVAEEGEELVAVRAAGLHQIVRALARGTHYGSAGTLPMVPGVDGVGTLADGRRVYFTGPRAPFGSMAERAAAKRSMCLELPDTLDDVAAAGLANPAMSSWGALRVRAQFQAGESVLILGATGTSGQLAVQIAKRLGARRVVAVGRNPEALAALGALGADATISLARERSEVVDALRAEIAAGGADVVLDYLWGEAAERMLEAIGQKGLSHTAPRIRYVQIGNMAGPAITLSAATLRSSRVELLGSGFGSASIEQLLVSIGEFFAEAGREPFVNRVRTAPLSEVAARWDLAEDGARLVFQP